MVEQITGAEGWLGFKVGVPASTLRRNQDLKVLLDSRARDDPIVKQMVQHVEDMLKAPAAANAAKEVVPPNLQQPSEASQTAAPAP